MASLEVKNNFDIKGFQNILFSKDNISNLNKQILENFNLNNLDKDNKKKIIDILIKTMKTIYKSKLDLKRIDNKNAKGIITQFNKASITETAKELSKDEDLLQIINPNSSKRKFQRDFESNPNEGNRIMDRPQAVSNKSRIENQFLYPPDYSKSKEPDSKFDRLFKPIVDNVNEEYKFNQYQSKDDNVDSGKRFDSLMAERSNESHMGQRPPTPDFLKPVQTSTRTQEPFKQTQSNTYTKKGGKPDFTKPIPENELSTGFLSANDNNDLYDINNIDKPLEIMEIEEDSRPFDQRLKNLQSERGSVTIKPSAEKINFQDPNLMIDADQIPEYQPKTIEDIKREKEEEGRRRQNEMRKQLDNSNFDERRQVINRNQNEEQRLLDQRLAEQRLSEQRLSEQRLAEQRLSEQRLAEQRLSEQRLAERNLLEQQKQLELERKLFELEKKKPANVIKSALKSSDTKVDMNKIQTMIKKITELDDLKEKIKESKEENERLKKKLLEEKPNFDFVKKEIGTEFTKLHARELEVLKKEEELKVLLKKYNYLYGLRHIQMDISPTTANSNYTFEFNKISNITGIKLMSYSVLQPRYNIEEDKNNIFSYIINDEQINIELKTGKYKIEDLLNNLTIKSNLLFDLNFEEKVTVKINIKEDSVDNLKANTFEILSTPLSQEILGFINTCSNSNNYIADRTWDLRVEDKIYLFLDNIEDTMPFAVLYFNNQSPQQFRFEEPIELDKLELTFKDSKGRLFNFYGLNYSLNIQLEINEE
jgi:hypothetical protein